MAFDPQLADIRFGCGLSPNIAPPVSVDAMIGKLRGPDHMAARYPSMTQDQFETRQQYLKAVKKEFVATEAAGQDDAEITFREKRRAERRAMRDNRLSALATFMQRAVFTEDGLRERLFWFWSDHFTVRGRGFLMRYGSHAYHESAVRPYITGRFADLLYHAVTGPAMLVYLNQTAAIGPNSRVGLLRKSPATPENLARELIELHTLGVKGTYSQSDVYQVALILTGLFYDQGNGMAFRNNRAEPGPISAFGRKFASKERDLRDIRGLCEYLAIHPDTAHHIALKLAVHFVSDTPSSSLVDYVAHRFTQTGGDLTSVYSALLEHPEAWDMSLSNVKPPFEYMTSALRALALHPETLPRTGTRNIQRFILRPMKGMGYDWFDPLTPAGAPEEDSDWVAPFAVAQRINWAFTAPKKFQTKLPDPREFVRSALGDFAPQSILFAAKAAEDRRDGVALVLASPAFQRR